MHEPWRHYASKVSQSQKCKHCQFHLYEEFNLVKLIEIKSRIMVAKDWGEGEIRSCSLSIVSGLQDKKVQEIYCMWIYLTLNYTLKNHKDDKF